MDNQNKQQKYIFWQRKRKPQDYKRFVIKVPPNFNCADLPFSHKEPKISIEDCASLLAELPKDMYCIKPQFYNNKESRTIMYGDIRQYEYNIHHNESSISLRYYLYGESEVWKKHSTYIYNGIEYEIFCFVSPLNTEEVDKNIKAGKDYYKKEHPFRVFSKRIRKLDFCTPLFKSTVQSLMFKQNNSAYLTRELFEDYDGYYKLDFIESEEYPLIYIDDQNEKRHIHHLVYVVAPFKEIIQRGNCIELDCSFYVFRPYVYCIPQMIIANESVPIGLIVGPTEKSDIFEEFYQYVREINPDCFITLKQKPLLSDQGSALISFATKYGLKHFFCIRHLLNKLGASSELASIAGSLLFSRSYDDFIHKWKSSMHTILFNLKDCSAKRIRQFTTMFSVEYDPINRTITTPTEEQLVHNLWTREKYGVPTCSNHSEATHAILNKKLKKTKNFPKRMITVLDHIESRIVNFSSRRNLINKIATIKPLEGECHCETNTFLDALYGVHIPCGHEKKDFVLKELDKIIIPDFFDLKAEEAEDSDWTFPKEKEYPNIEPCGYESLLLTAYGKPNYNELIFIAHQIKDPQEEDIKKALKFVVTAFITFSAANVGFYDYDSNVLGCFQTHIRKILGTMPEDAEIKYINPDYKKNIKLLIDIVKDADISSIEEYRISEQKAEKPIKTNEKRKVTQQRQKKEREELSEEEAAKLKSLIDEHYNELRNKSAKEFLKGLLKEMKSIEKYFD